MLFQLHSAQRTAQPWGSLQLAGPAQGELQRCSLHACVYMLLHGRRRQTRNVAFLLKG